ncbi:MAG: alpha-mannosidase, partial [Acidimicrobiia bacterium]
RFGVKNFRDHALADRSLYPFGWGDGGGGPTEDILASLYRTRDLDGMPKVEFSGPRAFFEAAEAETDDWPVWVGELYFECHRGTYTTQAAAKLGNRRAEGALRDAELWSAAVAGPSFAYPGSEIEAAWKLLLLHQFHDIIPGSGIHWVYEDTTRDHAAVAAATEAIIDAATTRIAADVDTSACELPVVVFNPASHERTELVSSPDGTPLAPVTVPPCGYTVLDLAPTDEPDSVRGDVAPDRLENEHLRVEFDTDGLIVSLYDKDAEREVVEPGARANLFQIHPDYPNFYDAWDVDRFAFETVTDISDLDSVEVVETGPLRAALRFTRTFGGSTIAQVVSLASGARRVVFTTDVDWRESNRLLKVAFPVTVRSPRATYEIQFGQVERPTHENTTWDEARFEVCAQQWADLSEPGYGVALLNDCKYGYDIRANVMRLSLLRAPSWPDPVADRGAHRFTYALLPHRGDVAAGRVVEEARELNQPLRLVREPRHAGTRPPAASLVTVTGLPLEVSAVKRADRTDGTVVRLVEVHGGRGTARLGLWSPIARAFRCDLLERDEAEVAVASDGTVELAVDPFEIVTLRLELS